MRIACLGGGPAGLYFAIAMKRRDPGHEIVVVERNRPYDTFGWGVVLSDETLANLAAADPESAEAIRREFVYWDDIAVFHRGTVTRSSGHGFCGIGRKRLLNILQERAQALGVELRFETEIDGLEPYRGYDLIVAADGVNSKVRGALAHVFKPDIDVRACKYIWLGTHAKFDDAFTFIFEETEHGWIWAHAYQFDADTATFIVECSEATWRRAGFDSHGPGGDDRRVREDLRQEPRRPSADDERPAPARLGVAQLQSRAVPDVVAREHRADGRRGGHRALLGRLRHQAGAGKRHRARPNTCTPSPPCRRPSGATRTSAAPRCCACRARRATPPNGSSRSSAISHLDPVQFNYSLLTRSQRISHENLRQRDKALARERGDVVRGAGDGREAQPLAAADVHAVPPARSARSRTASWSRPWRSTAPSTARRPTGTSCTTPSAPRAAPGSLYTEMTCVSPEGRITPGCTGLYAPEHEAAWKRIVDFVHAETDAKVAIQLGHSGPKGSTQLGWEEMDAPLARRQLAGDGAVAGGVVAGQPGAARR